MLSGAVGVILGNAKESNNGDNMTQDVSLIITTFPDQESAENAARLLLKEHLAACINIIPGVSSFFRWQGEIENSSELLLVIKTTDGNLEILEKRLTQLHPYKVFEFVVLNPDSVNKAYADWVLGSCS